MATILDPFAQFIQNQVTFNPSLSFYTGDGSVSIYKLFAGPRNIPLYIRTGKLTLGEPTERKKFRYVEFYGKGTAYARVYIDGRWIADDFITETEQPGKPRRMNLPKDQGNSGYAIDIELVGDITELAMEISWDAKPRTS